MAALRKILRRLLGDAGAEFIEMALAFPMLLLVVLGILDFGLLFQQYLVITNAAREGARVAVLPEYSGTLAQATANATTRVTQYTQFALANPADVSTSVAAGSVDIGGKEMATYTVTVTYPHEFIFLSGIGSYFGSSFGTTTLTARATMRTEAAAATP